VDACRAEGVLVLPCGERSIRLRPFLDLTKEDAAKGLALLGAALRRLA